MSILKSLAGKFLNMECVITDNTLRTNAVEAQPEADSEEKPDGSDTAQSHNQLIPNAISPTVSDYYTFIEFKKYKDHGIRGTCRGESGGAGWGGFGDESVTPPVTPESVQNPSNNGVNDGTIGLDEESGTMSPKGDIKVPLDEIAAVEEFFPGSKWIGEVFPGDTLPPWAAEIMASDPDLPQAWWDTEGFQLTASGVGIPERPPAIPPMVNEQEERNLRHWAAIAENILSGLIPVDLKSSEFGSLEIGLRGAHRIARCVEAHQKILDARKADELEKRTARLLRLPKPVEAR